MRIESDILKKYHLKYVPYSLCQLRYRDVAISIDDSDICAEPAGNQSQDTCDGDSGGPLICYQEGRAYIVGITSFGGSTCGDMQRPGVYRSVPTWYQENFSLFFPI